MSASMGASSSSTREGRASSCLPARAGFFYIHAKLEPTVVWAFRSTAPPSHDGIYEVALGAVVMPSSAIDLPAVQMTPIQGVDDGVAESPPIAPAS